MTERGMANLSEPSLDTKGSRKTKKKGNGADETTVDQLDLQPYVAEVKLVGVAPILFHAYDCESVERKAKAKKGSEEKKTDDIDSFVYRNDKGYLCIPAINLKACLADAAKRFQDPSSSRKSARDLVKAAVMVGPHLASLGVKKWAGIDKRRAVVQRAAVTRHRPYLAEGWSVKFEIEVLEATFITPEFLRNLLDHAGRFNGLCDFRPDFGRFRVDSWKISTIV